MVGVLLCVSFVISSVVVNSARTYHASVIEEIEASGFDEVVIQKCIEAAEQDNYGLKIEEVKSAESGVPGFYQVTLYYKLSAPIFGVVHNGEVVGYAAKGTRIVEKLKPGLYLTGSDYGVLLKSWDELISEGVVSVTDGVVSTGFTSGNNASSDALAGDLMLPFDGSVTDVGNLAFFKCTQLTGVKIPDNVKTIGRQAFDGCWVLTTVELGNGIEFIDYNAFGYDPIQNVIYNGTTEDWCKITFDSWWSNPAYCGGNAVLYLKEEPLVNIMHLSIPSTVTSLENKFTGCKSLLSVVIPDDSQLTAIDNYAFGRCYNLKTVEIGSSIKKIGSNAFLSCALEYFVIPKSVVEISPGAFSGCDKLTDFYYEGTMDEWFAIKLDDDWDEDIPDYTIYFSNGSSMTKEEFEIEKKAREEAESEAEAGGEASTSVDEVTETPAA